MLCIPVSHPADGNFAGAKTAKVFAHLGWFLCAELHLAGRDSSAPDFYPFAFNGRAQVRLRWKATGSGLNAGRFTRKWN